MKLTKSKLKQIIKEELGKVLSENTQVDPVDPVKEINKKVGKWTGVKNETSPNGPNPDDILNTIAYYVPDLIRTGSFAEGLWSDFYWNRAETKLEDINKKINFIKNSGHERADEALEDIEYARNYFEKEAAKAL
tara:strand:+ start:14728 stop:15129 length:402 start_codon:yes stop_codon:yes gene_type:complete